MDYYVGLVMGTPTCTLYSNLVQWQGYVNRVLHHSQGRLVGKQTYHDQNTFTSLSEVVFLDNTLHRGIHPYYRVGDNVAVENCSSLRPLTIKR